VTDVFVRGWVGNANGEKYEAFNMHLHHSRYHEQFQNSIGQLKMFFFLPEVKAWSLKISETLGWRSAFNAQHFTPVLCGHTGK
jgi:hypothetical protein